MELEMANSLVKILSDIPLCDFNTAPVVFGPRYEAPLVVKIVKHLQRAL